MLHETSFKGNTHICRICRGAIHPQSFALRAYGVPPGLVFPCLGDSDKYSPTTESDRQVKAERLHALIGNREEPIGQQAERAAHVSNYRSTR